MTETEAKERYTNILSSSFRALVRLLEELTDKNNKNIIEICGNTALWKNLTNKDYPEIRAAAFKLVTACCKFNPELLINENKQVQTTISLPVVGCFQETSSLVHGDMIDALLSMLKTYAPEQVWGTTAKPLLSTTKAIFPRLFAFLRSPATSSPSLTFASMLPFLSFLNQEVCLQCCHIKFHNRFWEAQTANLKISLTPFLPAYGLAFTRQLFSKSNSQLLFKLFQNV